MQRTYERTAHSQQRLRHVPFIPTPFTTHYIGLNSMRTLLATLVFCTTQTFALAQSDFAKPESVYAINPALTPTQAKYTAIIKMTENRWQISSLNERTAINDSNEEIVLIDKSPSGKLVFTPYFNLRSPETTSSSGRNRASCRGLIPYGVNKNYQLDRARETNVCDSLLMIDSDPETSTLAKVGSSAILGVFTMGLTLAAQAATYGNDRYLNKNEFRKVVADTNLDQLIDNLENAFAKRSRVVTQSNADWTRKASNIKTKFEITDKTGGFVMDSDSVNSLAGNLVRYAAIKPVPESPAKGSLPKSLEDFPQWSSAQDQILENFANTPPRAYVYCQNGETLVGNKYRVTISSCPNTVAANDEPIVIPISVLSMDSSVTPKLSAEDKQLKVWLDADGLKFENLTTEFIDIKDISFSVNSQTFSQSGANGATQLTLPPQSTYPRSTERSKFTLLGLTDERMRDMLAIKRITVPTAKQQSISFSLAVRYSVDNTNIVRALRGTKSSSVYELIGNK